LPVSIDKAVISRLTTFGQKFEVLVDPNEALKLKKGVKVDMNEILAYPGIYRDVRSTERVSEEELQKIFGTSDVFKVAEKIIREGELQLTTEQRRRMIEEKKSQIAEIIARKGINPQTNTPHPPQRILNVMEKVGVNIDPFVDAELQVDKVLKEIRVMIPIKFQKTTIQIKVPPQYAGRIYSILKNSGTILNEKWLNDGSLQINIQVLAGMQDELFQKISNLTHGEFESKIIKREDM
jgi:ribosome maturation protein SDO1